MVVSEGIVRLRLRLSVPNRSEILRGQCSVNTGSNTPVDASPRLLGSEMARRAGQLHAQADKEQGGYSSADAIDAMVAAVEDTAGEKVITENVTDFQQLGCWRRVFLNGFTTMTRLRTATTVPGFRDSRPREGNIIDVWRFNPKVLTRTADNPDCVRG